MKCLPLIPHTWKKRDYSTGVAECEWVCVSALTCRFKGSKQIQKLKNYKKCKTKTRLIDFTAWNGCICGTMAAGSQCKTGRVQTISMSPAHNLRTQLHFTLWSEILLFWALPDAFCFCYMTTNKQWAVAANGLALRECFLMQHIWWIWLKTISELP